MYYIGLDVHKKTISYCVKDVAGHQHGSKCGTYYRLFRLDSSPIAALKHESTSRGSNPLKTR
jgi:hypothetical protein